MKQIFTCFFTKKIPLLMAVTLLFATKSVIAQTTATEDFDTETSASSFSESGVNFTHTFLLQNIPGYGYGGSAKFLELANNTTSTTLSASISINNALNPSVSYKINSFAAYVSAGGAGATPYNGSITVTGTPVGSSTAVSATINIGSASGSLPAGQTRDANGIVNGLTFTGTPLAGLYFTSLSFTVFDSNINDGTVGTRYLELDHMNFTTQLPSSNQFSISDASITEGSGSTKSMAFTVSCTSTSTASSVQVQSSNGTATAGSDYVAFPLTTVSFAVGDPTSKTVNVTINGDLTIEPDETFNMNLSNPVGGTIFDGTGIGTILDDDNITETFEDETVPTGTISTVTGFAERGFNFTSNGDLFVSRGNNTGAGNCGCTSSALDTRTGNGISSGNVGSFYINSAGTSFNLNSLDVYTSNNDGTSGTTVNVSVTFTGAKADGSGNVSYTATVTPISGFNYQTINFTGTPFANVQILSVSVTLGAGINYVALDNIKYGTVTFSGVQLSINDVSVLEGTGGGATTATFTVTRSSNSSAFSVNVASSDLSATAGQDYVAYNSTLNFTSGGPLSQTVTVTILQDALIEGNETFNMTLSGATNGVLYQKPVGTGTILDDDKVVETFEEETDDATTFSENSITFLATNRFKVNISANSGSGSSKGYLSSSPSGTSPNTGGSQGKISITSSIRAFKLLQLDAWTATGTTPSFVTGPVTFTGTLFGGGTVTTTKTITPTNNTGTGWQQNITFTGTPLDNAVLTDLEFIAGGTVTTIEIDNINYVAVSTLPYIEVTDASNVPITNGGAATVTNNTDFGTTCAPGSSVAKTFTIKNTGAVNLTLSGSPLAILGGANAAQFSVTTQPSATVAGNSSTIFTVSYTPTAAGTHNATITLTNNDATNSPYVINIKGAANAAVAIGTQPVNQVMTGNGTNGSGNAVFTVLASNATGYQWQIKNGASYNNISNTTPYSGVTTNTLTIANPFITTFNNAVYRCVITGTSPCAAVNSIDASLTIISPGGITLPSGTLTGTDINAGTDAGWTYYSLGGFVGFAIQWNGNVAAKAGAVVSTTNATKTTAMNASPPRAVYAMARYWNVTSPALSPAVNIRFFYSGSDQSGVTSDATNFAIGNGSSNDGFRWFKTVGTPYSPANVTNAGITGNAIVLTGIETAINNVQQVQFTGISNFSGGTGEASSGLGAVILPLQLVSFSGVTNGTSALLQWKTTNEIHVNYFELERSTDAVHFTKIGQLSAGNSNYSFTDKPDVKMMYYYRLKIVDKDGKMSYSYTVAINLTKATITLQVLPNPFTDKLMLNMNAAQNGDAEMRLTDMSGKVLVRKTVALQPGNNAFTLNQLSHLSKGVYMLQITNDKINEVVKIVKGE